MNKRCLLPGVFITSALFVLSVLFVLYLNFTYLFPIKYILLACSVFLFICGSILLLTRNVKKKVMFILGCVLTAVTVAVMVLGFVVLQKITTTIKSVTSNNVETVSLSVYVKNEDSAKSLKDTKDYTFCILKTLDRKNTDIILKEINSELGKTVKLQEYDTLVELANAVLNGDKKVMVINSELLSILTEIEGYENIIERLREISVKVIEIPIVDNTVKDEEVEGIKDGVFVMYISGIDSRRSSLNVRSRSDVNIIATVNTKTHEIFLLTTPRDYYVPLSISNGQPDKLTHAGIYGVNVSIETLEMLYDIEIDYYFRVNFTGFCNIIDAIGGVDVYSDYTFYSYGGVKYSKGYNHLNGQQALWFARERKHTVGGGDSERAKHQMEVIRAVLQKLSTTPALLENFTPLMESVEGSFQCSMSYETIAGLVRNQLNSMPAWNITTYSVTGVATYKIPYSLSAKAWVLIPNEDTIEIAKQKMQAVINGERLSN